MVKFLLYNLLFCYYSPFSCYTLTWVTGIILSFKLFSFFLIIIMVMLLGFYTWNRLKLSFWICCFRWANKICLAASEFPYFLIYFLIFNGLFFFCLSNV